MMTLRNRNLRRTLRSAAAAALFAITAAPAFAQAPLPVPVPPPQTPSTTAAPPLPAVPPPDTPAELDRIVSPIALYPDPLLAQVLAASTFPDDIVFAARWADDHHYLTGAQLAAAITTDDVAWDPAVQALLPFPSVLEMMASDMPWTKELGDAFLSQHDAVMDAVQRMRREASGYGYLSGCTNVIMQGGPFIEIQPVDPAFIVVPYYDPQIAFFPPRPGFVMSTAVYCGFGIRLGVWFRPWGWGLTRFAWATHDVFINNAPWRRTWANRSTYVHPYTVRRGSRPQPPEHHPLRPRTPADRAHERPPAGRDGARGGSRGGR